MYQNILFDLDGTLTDSAKGITNSVAYALIKMNIEVPNKTELYKFIGPPLYESFSKYYNMSDEQSSQAVVFYREYYSEKGIFENDVYDGVKELLVRLQEKGKRLILSTSKPELYANKILKHFELDSYFDFVAGATMDGIRSRKDDIVQYAIESCNIADLSSAVMIGDRKHDILGAKKAGIASIGVLYGYGRREELEQAGATYIAQNVKDVYGIIAED